MILPILVTLIAVIFNISIGVWLLARRPSMPLNRAAFAIAVLLSAWGVSEMFVLLAESPKTALAMDHISNVAGQFLSVAVIAFMAAYRKEAFGETSRWTRPLLAIFSISAVLWIAALIGTDLVVRGIEPLKVGFRFLPGPLYAVFILVLIAVVVSLSVSLFVRSLRVKDSLLRRQSLVLSLSPFFTVTAFLALEYIPGILQGDRTMSSYPATMAFTAILAFASYRLQLMSLTPDKTARQVLEAQPDGVLLVDRMGRIQYNNQSFLRLVEKKEGVLDEPAHIDEFLAIRSKGYESLFRMPLADLPPLLDLRGDLLTPGGEKIPVVVAFQKIDQPHHESPGAVVVLRDERPLRKLEAEMIHLEKMHSLGIMVSGIAHELNNPLTAILGYAELGKTPLETDTACQYFQTIYTQGRKAHDVIKNLVDFAGSALSFECPLSLNRVAEEIIKIRKYDIELSGHTVVFDFAPDLPQIMIDPHKIKQIILNIFNNAAQALERSGRQGEIRIRTAIHDRNVVVEISDTGAGIPREIQARIFDPFFTTLDPGQGTGLGLSISQVMVADMGGRIEMETREGEGTLFRVSFPLVEPKAEKPRHELPHLMPDHVFEGPRILVVDDDDTVVAMMKEVLTVKGCTVDAASDGEEGLCKMLQSTYNVIFLDMKMPRLDGRATIERLRREAPHILPSIVLCTGDTAEPKTQTFLHVTDLHTLIKPFRIRELLSVVQSILDKAVSDGGRV